MSSKSGTKTPAVAGPVTSPADFAPQTAIEVSAGLIFRSGQLLIAQRRAADPMGGLWEFPGGKREPNETFEECLIRELQEELGVVVRVGELFESVTHAYAERTVHLKFFRCELRAGEPQPLACAAVKWVRRSDLAAHAFPAADEQLLLRLLAADTHWETRP